VDLTLDEIYLRIDKKGMFGGDKGTEHIRYTDIISVSSEKPFLEPMR